MPRKAYTSFKSNRPGARNQPFYGHDDRDVRMDDVSANPPTSNLRVSLKRDGRISKVRSGNDNRKVTFNNTGRGGNRGGYRRGAQPGRSIRIGHESSHCYKVIVPYGRKYAKDFIISNLSTLLAPDVLTPIMYKVEHQDALFYVDDPAIAGKIRGCNRKIQAADGFEIGFKVYPSSPETNVDATMKDRLKVALAKRYVESTNALDLSRFHYDPDLVDDYFCALFKPPVLVPVLDIVAEALPNLEALNLDKNKFYSIDKLASLKRKLPNLKILYLGDNYIRDIKQLEALRGMKLDELKLSGNPVCEKYKNRHDDYVSDVRKRLPKLLRLDGEELPKPIVFDLGDDGIKLMPSRQIYTVNPQAQEIANQFMQQFFLIYDSGNRQPLLDAYHEQALFSLTVSYPPAASAKFSDYQSENRNLLKVNDSARRRKLLKQGRLSVVSFITELPKTQHFLDSFTMDIDLVTETMMLIKITGCFKEINDKDDSIRYFDRVFTVVPEGSGYCITNEQLFVCPATAAQEKKVRNPTPAAAAAAPVPAATPSTSAAAAGGGEPSDDVKQQMIVTLSQQTNMKLEWSLKCLQEVQWRYDTALAAFNDFNSRGLIPPDAFQSKTV